jgi:2-polyprenyl-3-methyl-5-hydroxy-6-metoxy-1,4-benzoquinol methylase
MFVIIRRIRKALAAVAAGAGGSANRLAIATSFFREIDLACPVCREKERLASFEQRLDADGRLTELAMCQNCHAVLNATDLRRVLAGEDDRSHQALSSDQFYAVDEAFLSDLQAQVDQNHMIDFLVEQVPDLKRGTLIEFGAGRGINAASAAKIFDRVYAVELTLNVLEAVHAHLVDKDKIILTSDFESIDEKCDAITSMHVFEHLPNLRDFIDIWVDKLRDGGVIFFQVPMLRRDYIVPVHYTFFNELCVRSLASEIGFDVVGVWFDSQLDFLTCILRKPGGRT